LLLEEVVGRLYIILARIREEVVDLAVELLADLGVVLTLLRQEELKWLVVLLEVEIVVEEQQQQQD
jgi:hypothetical protein